MLYLRAPKEHVWEQFAQEAHADDALLDPLQRSWQRSLGDGACAQGPTHSNAPVFLGPQALKRQQEANERSWYHVRPVLETLSHQLARGGFLAVWADPDGVILYRKGGGAFLTTAQHVELLEGATWTEQARGTNAIGTALRESCDVAVLGRAHLQKTNHGLVCYASPVRNPQGQVIGVLDVTSRLECAQEMAPVALLAAKSAIELSLKLAAYEHALHGGLEGLCQSIEFFPSPAILLERDGTLRASNRAYKRTFGLSDSITPLRQAIHGAQVTMDQVQLVDINGQTRLYRLSAEPVGPHPDAAVAMLIFIEPIGVIYTSKPAPPEVSSEAAFSGFFGTDEVFCHTLSMAKRFARTSLPVMLLAKTGTGKERLARAVHDLSERRDGPFIPINCGALSGSLLEAELFGYADGAFTGAKKGGAPGKLAVADGGTLFLDEVAEMTPSAQAMLLRVLDEGTYYRVGDAHVQRTDVRIIAATCRNLVEMVAQERFRSDLYYRLKGATLTLPALRERSDIELLARHLLREIHGDTPGRPPAFSSGFLHALSAYEWPGNIRELKNALHVAWVLRDDAPLLLATHLPQDIQQALHNMGSRSGSTQGTKDSAEQQALLSALDNASGNMSQAARILGVARSTLYRMMERHGLR